MNSGLTSSHWSRGGSLRQICRVAAHPPRAPVAGRRRHPERNNALTAQAPPDQCTSEDTVQQRQTSAVLAEQLISWDRDGTVRSRTHSLSFLSPLSNIVTLQLPSGTALQRIPVCEYEAWSCCSSLTEANMQAPAADDLPAEHPADSIPAAGELHKQPASWASDHANAVADITTMETRWQAIIRNSTPRYLVPDLDTHFTQQSVELWARHAFGLRHTASSAWLPPPAATSGSSTETGEPTSVVSLPRPITRASRPRTLPTPRRVDWHTNHDRPKPSNHTITHQQLDVDVSGIASTSHSMAVLSTLAARRPAAAQAQPQATSWLTAQPAEHWLAPRRPAQPARPRRGKAMPARHGRELRPFLASAQASALTRHICEAADWRSVGSVFVSHRGALDAIHTSALVVRLAKVRPQVGSLQGAALQEFDELVTGILADARGRLLHMDHRQVSNVLWALASARLATDPELLRELVQRSTDLMQHSNAASLAMTAWAAAQLGLDLPQEWTHRFLAQSHSLLGQFAPHELSNLLWAMARLKLQPAAEWLGDYLAAAAQLLPSCSPQNLANMLWALASLRRLGCGAAEPDPPWLARFMESCSRQVADFTPQGTSVTLWALAALDVRPQRRWLSSMLADAERKLPAFNSDALSNTIWALARLGHQAGSRWMHTFRSCVSANLASFHGIALSTTAWALAKLGGHSAEQAAQWMQPLLQGSRERLHDLGPVALANLVWALARVGEHPGREWMDAFMAASEMRLAACGPQELATLAWALAVLREQPSRSWSEAYLAVLGRKVGAFNAVQVANTTWAVAALRLLPEQSAAALTSPPSSLGSAAVQAGRPTSEGLFSTVDDLAAVPGSSAWAVHALLVAMERQMGSQEGQALSDCVWALAKLQRGVGKPVVQSCWAAAMRRLGYTLHTCSPLALVNIVWASAALRTPLHATVRDPLLQRLAPALPELPPPQLHALAVSMARLDEQLPSGWLFALLKASKQKAGSFPPDRLVQVVIAVLTRLCTGPRTPRPAWLRSCLATLAAGELCGRAALLQLVAAVDATHGKRWAAWFWQAFITQEQLASLAPGQLSMVLEATTLLRWKPPQPWLAAAARAVQAGLHALTPPQAAATVLSALALGMPLPPETTGALLAASTTFLPTSTIRQLMGLLAVSGQLGLRAPAAWVNAVAEHVWGRFASLTPRGRVYAVSVLSQMGAPGPPAALTAAVETSLGPQVLRMSPVKLSLLLAALVALGVRPPRAWLAHAEGVVGEAMASMAVRPLVQLLWGFALVGHEPQQPWMAAFLQQVGQQLPVLEARDLSAVLGACALMGEKPGPEWLDRYLAESWARMRSFGPESLATTLWALALLHHRPRQPWLDRFFPESQAAMHAMSGGQLARTLWGLARLSAHPPATWLADYMAAVTRMLELHGAATGPLAGPTMESICVSLSVLGEERWATSLAADARSRGWVGVRESAAAAPGRKPRSR